MILHILAIALAFKDTYQLSCMDLKEIIKLQNPYSSDSTAKKTLTIAPSSQEVALSFYFKTDFDDTKNHMTIMSFKDTADLSFSLDIFNQTSTDILEVKMGQDNSYGISQGVINDKEWYFLLFEWKFDNGGTQSFRYIIYHPTETNFDIYQAEGAFSYAANTIIYIGGNYDDLAFRGKENNFRGEVNHAYTYTGHVDTIMSTVLRVNIVTSFGINYERQSLLSKNIVSEDGEAMAIKHLDQKNTKTNDILKLPGTDLLDWRFDQFSRHQSSYVYGQRYVVSKTNLLQYWFYMRISVYDSVSTYTLTPGTIYDEEQRTTNIFRKEIFSGYLTGPLLYGFYHKLTSTHESVGPGPGENKHSSYFYFKVGESGELCPSNPIESLNSDLGLTWFYVKANRDMWSDNMVFTMRTNLMTDDCVHSYPTSTLGFTHPNGIIQIGPGKSYVPGKPKVFYYHIKQIKDGTGGDLFLDDDPKDCLNFLHTGSGYFANSYAVIECPSPKVRVLNECLDPSVTTSGCVHNGSPCKLCKLGYAFDSVTKTCHQCPADCETCSYDQDSARATCTICNQRFAISNGDCVACLASEVWDSKTFNCFPGEELTLKSGYVYNGLTTPGNPYTNGTYVVIEAKYTVGPTGTYGEEEVYIKVGGWVKSRFYNITSPLYDYQDNSYTFFITMNSLEKFETLEFVFTWGNDPDKAVTIDYVRAHDFQKDLEADCLLEKSNGQCLECNKYKLKIIDFSTLTCKDYDENKYIRSTSFNGVDYYMVECSTDGSIKKCWHPNGGVVECGEDYWILIDGNCPACDSSCLGCKGNSVLNTTDYLYNCISCPPGATGLRPYSNGTKGCVSCQSPNCLSCPNDWSVCEECTPGFEIIDGECLIICSEGMGRRDQTTCVPCHENCNGCGGEGTSKCSSCASGMLQTMTNCSDPLNGFCCYNCPLDEGCSDCSWDGQCSQCSDPNFEVDEHFKCVQKPPDLEDELDELDESNGGSKSNLKIKIIESYFFKSKGEIVIVFDRKISIKTLSGSYVVKAKLGTKISACSLEKAITYECRLKIIDEGKEILGEVVTFRVLEGSTVENFERGESYTIEGKRSVRIEKISYYDAASGENLRRGGLVSSISVRATSAPLLLTERASFLQVFKLTQYVESLLYFDIEYPTNLYNLLKFFNVGLFEQIPNPMEGLHEEQCRPQKQFIENGVECYFLGNMGLDILVVAGTFVLKILVVLLAQIYETCKGKKKDDSWLLLANSKFNSSIFILLLDMLFFELVIFSCLQIRHMSFTTLYLSINSFFGLVSLLTCLGFMVVTFLFIQRLVKKRPAGTKLAKTRTSPKLKGFSWIEKISMVFIFEGLNMKNPVGKYYILISQVKIFLNSIIVVFLGKTGLVQVLLNLFMNISFLGLIIWRRPYKSKMAYVKDLIVNFLLSLALIVCLLLTNEVRYDSEKKNYTRTGKFGVVIFSTLFLATALFSLYEAVGSAYEFIKKFKARIQKKKKRKKNKITPSRRRLKGKKAKNKRKSRMRPIPGRGLNYDRFGVKLEESKTKIERKFNIDRVLRMNEAFGRSKKRISTLRIHSGK